MCIKEMFDNAMEKVINVFEEKQIPCRFHEGIKQINKTVEEVLEKVEIVYTEAEQAIAAKQKEFVERYPHGDYRVDLENASFNRSAPKKQKGVTMFTEEPAFISGVGSDIAIPTGTVMADKSGAGLYDGSFDYVIKTLNQVSFDFFTASEILEGHRPGVITDSEGYLIALGTVCTPAGYPEAFYIDTVGADRIWDYNGRALLNGYKDLRLFVWK